MDGQDRIVRVDGQWTIIQCGKCSDCFKVLTSKHKWQMNCPYCSHVVEIAHEPKLEEAAESFQPGGRTN